MESISNINYVLNIENIMDFIFNFNTKRDTDSEITEFYDNDDDSNLVLKTKQIREVKGGDNTSKATIRYDMIKLFIDILSGMDSAGTDCSFTERLVLNTMLNEELISEVK